MSKTISGFSKLSKSEKINWIVDTYFSNSKDAEHILKQYWNSDNKLQQLHDEFIENIKKGIFFEVSILQRIGSFFIQPSCGNYRKP